MEKMKGTPNPFLNGTVIIEPNPHLTTDQIKSFLDKAYELLDTFQDDILNLVYCFEIEGMRMEEISTSKYFISQQLLNILCMKNLKRLALDFCWGQFETFWSIRSHKLFQEMLEDVTLSENLTELYISSGNPIAPLFYMFKGSESILKSVENLAMANFVYSPYFRLPPDKADRLRFTMCQFPNLKKLKVDHPDAKFLKKFQQFQLNSVASLREVSFLFKQGKRGMCLDVKESFELLDLHAETLEVLHFQFRVSFREDAVIFSSVKYPKLKKLVLWCNDIYNQPVTISALMPKLVNLMEVKLLQLPDDYVQIRPRDQYKRVLAFWDQLPATVRVIHVPLYGWRIKRGDTLQFD